MRPRKYFGMFTGLLGALLPTTAKLSQPEMRVDRSASRKGKRSKDVARRRRRNKIARASRRVNRGKRR